MKMEKETWQYFSNQHLSIKNRKIRSVKLQQEQNQNPCLSFFVGLYEIFRQFFQKDTTFMIS